MPRVVAGGTPTFPVYARLEIPGLECSPGTLVLHTAAPHLGDLAAALTENGLGPQTPVAVTAAGTQPTQRTVQTTLAGLDDVWAGGGPEPPGQLVVAVGSGAEMIRQSEAHTRRLEALGAESSIFCQRPLPIGFDEHATRREHRGFPAGCGAGCDAHAARGGGNGSSAA